MKTTLLLAAAMFALAACHSDERGQVVPQSAAPDVSVTTGPTAQAPRPTAAPSASLPQTDPSAAEMAAAPAELVIDGRRYRLETYLWRDFMPMVPPAARI